MWFVHNSHPLSGYAPQRWSAFSHPLTLGLAMWFSLANGMWRPPYLSNSFQDIHCLVLPLMHDFSLPWETMQHAMLPSLTNAAPPPGCPDEKTDGAKLSRQTHTTDLQETNVCTHKALRFGNCLLLQQELTNTVSISWRLFYSASWKRRDVNSDWEKSLWVWEIGRAHSRR